MKHDLKEGLSMGLSIWFLTVVLGIPLAFLQMGYNPRYLLQLTVVIVLLVRCCKNPTVTRWASLFMLEGLVLLTAVLHIIRGMTENGGYGFAGLAFWICGIFFGFITFILGAISVCLFLRYRD